MIPFAPWAPDAPELDSEASKNVQNVVPSEAGFRPLQDLVPITAALPSRVRGAFACRSPTLGINNFAGTATKLYKLDTGGLTFTDVTRASGGDYTLTNDDWWSFAQFGTYVMATCLTDNPQYYEMGVSTDFAQLAGSPPRAAFIGVLRDFVVLARLSTDYNGMRWSGINDQEDWTPSATTMSGQQTFPEGGPITGFVGGEYGVVFQDRAINRMAFEGPPTIFRFDRVATNVGCRVSTSIAQSGGLIFFLSDDGFKMLTGGSELTDIGLGKIDRFFENDLNITYLNRVSAAIDPVNKLYVVGYPSGGSAVADKILMYHWPTGAWTHGYIEHDIIYPAITQTSYTIDTMNLISATINGLSQPVDSRFWSGTARLLLAAYDSDHKQSYFTGPSLRAQFETTDVQINPGSKSLVRGVRPIIEGDGLTVSVRAGRRDRMHDSILWGAASDANSLGYSPLRSMGRYHRFRVNLAAGSLWSLARGIDDVKSSAMERR